MLRHAFSFVKICLSRIGRYTGKTQNSIAGGFAQTLGGYQVRCAYDFQDGKLTLIDKDQDAEAESVTRFIKRELEE